MMGKEVLRRSSPYGQKGIAEGGKILLKKILFIPEDDAHYMIEIIQFDSTKDIKVIAYDV
jgi:hypothetical protein